MPDASTLAQLLGCEYALRCPEATEIAAFRYDPDIRQIDQPARSAGTLSQWLLPTDPPNFANAPLSIDMRRWGGCAAVTHSRTPPPQAVCVASICMPGGRGSRPNDAERERSSWGVGGLALLGRCVKRRKAIAPTAHRIAKRMPKRMGWRPRTAAMAVPSAAWATSFIPRAVLSTRVMPAGPARKPPDAGGSYFKKPS